jgi:hypothetical protein
VTCRLTGTREKVEEEEEKVEEEEEKVEERLAIQDAYSACKLTRRSPNTAARRELAYE